MRTFCLNLIVLLLSATALTAQTEKPKPPPTPKPKPVEAKPAKPAEPPSIEAKIASAIKNHPDVRLAEAKLLMAEAELDRAKLAIAQQVMAATAKFEQLQVEAEVHLRAIEKLEKSGTAIGALERLQYESKAFLSKSAFQAAEAELKSLIGSPKPDRQSYFRRQEPETPKEMDYGVPESLVLNQALRDLITVSVTINLPELRIDEAFAQLQKQSGVEGLVIRSSCFDSMKDLKNPPKTKAFSGTLTVAAWIELIMDDFRSSRNALPADLKDCEIYVREYGLLIEQPARAPGDAVRLSDFVRAVGERKKVK